MARTPLSTTRRESAQAALDHLIASGRRFSVLEHLPESRQHKIIDLFVNPPSGSRHRQINKLCTSPISSSAASRFVRAMVGRIEQATAEPDIGPPMLTISQVAAKLQISQTMVRKLIQRGNLSAHRIGRQVRIDVNSMETYLAKCRVQPPK